MFFRVKWVMLVSIRPRRWAFRKNPVMSLKVVRRPHESVKCVTCRGWTWRTKLKNWRVPFWEDASVNWMRVMLEDVRVVVARAGATRRTCRFEVSSKRGKM